MTFENRGNTDDAVTKNNDVTASCKKTTFLFQVTQGGDKETHNSSKQHIGYLRVINKI